MKAYIAFVKKEFMESIRTFKALILLIVFLLLGFMNSITARYLPELIKEFMPAGMSITLEEPTVMDSWMQFFKNVPQMGLIVILIVFGTIISGELSKGTLTNMLTKGLKRSSVIGAKLTVAIVLWTVCYYLSFLVTLLYNHLFFTDTKVPFLFLSVSCVWVFGSFLICILILGGVLFRSTFGGLLLTGGVVAALLFLNILPKLAQYNPVQLVSVNMGILEGSAELSDVYMVIGLTSTLMIITILITILLFNRKNIL